MHFHWINKMIKAFQIQQSTFNISQKIKDLGYDVLKTYEIEMLHIDGNKEVIKYPNTQQKFR